MTDHEYEPRADGFLVQVQDGDNLVDAIPCAICAQVKSEHVADEPEPEPEPVVLKVAEEPKRKPAKKPAARKPAAKPAAKKTTARKKK